MTVLRSYTEGQWRTPAGEGAPLHDAVTGDEVARISSDGIDLAGALSYGRSVGGPALRELTFHQRSALLKSLGSYLREHREELYALSARTGATLADSKFDVDGGIGVLASYASRGRRALPNDTVYVDGEVEPMLQAVSLARQAPLLVEHAGACEDAARLLAQAGRRDESAALLTEALDRYEQAGADAWAGRVRARLRALGVRPGPRGSRGHPAGGWESLTTTEQAVSRLVAEGLTNGAVARRLYISPHTVNTHLRHVFAKLAVTNRVALAAEVHHSIE